LDVKSEKNVRDMLASTNKEYYVVMDKLKRVVASGNFHHEFIPKHVIAAGSTENVVQIIDGIPLCCKVTLRGLEAPLVLNITYLSKANPVSGHGGGADLKIFVSQKNSEPSAS